MWRGNTHTCVLFFWERGQLARTCVMKVEQCKQTDRAPGVQGISGVNTYKE